MAEELGQALLNVDVRPIRLAYLAAASSEEDFREAVLEASSRWGGIQEPILAIDGDGAILEGMENLLELMPVDYLCSISDRTRPFDTQLATSLKRHVFSLAQVQRGNVALHATAVRQPSGTPATSLFGSRQNDPITSLAALGAAWDEEQVRAWQQVSLPLFPMPYGRDQLVGAQLNESSVICATGRQCGETTLYNFTEGPLLLWLAEPDSLQDAWWYWNTRTLVPLRGASMPSVLVPLTEDAATNLLPMVQAACGRRPFVCEPDILVYSRSIHESTAMDFVRTLGIAEHSGDFKVSWATEATDRSRALTAAFGHPARFLARRRDLGVRAVTPVYVRRKQTIVSVDSPVQFRPFGGQIRVRFSGPPSFALPESPSVPALFIANAVQSQRCVEITTHPANHFTVYVDVPERAQVMTSYLHDKGIDHQPSDKGRLARGVLSLSPLISVLRNPVALAVIEALTRHRFKYELAEARREVAGADDAQLERLAASLQDVRQLHRTLEQIAGAIGSTGTSVDRPMIGKIVGLLTDAQLVYRGLEVACDVCGVQSFTELTAAHAPARCPGCGSVAGYKADSNGQPLLYYRLNALLDRASDVGVLPHVVMEVALRQKFGEDQVANLPGVDLTLQGGAKREADCLALIQARVWLGEAKTQSSAFTDAQIERDMTLAQAVGADTYLMTCLNGLERSRIETAVQATVNRGMRLALLQSADGEIREFTAVDLHSMRQAADQPSLPSTEADGVGQAGSTTNVAPAT